jgi:hypothetical protein
MDLRDQLQETLGDAYTLERFKREILLAAKFQHPHIVITSEDFNANEGNRSFTLALPAFQRTRACAGTPARPP